MGIIFTLPRLSELDSQARGRLHAFMEMTDKENGEWAELKYLNWRPTRDERDDIYRSYPRLRINGTERKVKRLRFSLPPDGIIKEYEQRKSTFQDEMYQKAIDEMQDEADEDEMGVKDVAADIEDAGIGDFVSLHSQNKTPLIDKQLIRAEYELTHRDAKAVKSILAKKYDDEELMDHV
jgi:hypothetical protein